MIELFFLIMTLAFLWACYSCEEFFKTRSWGAFFSRHMLRAIEIYLQSLALVSLYTYGIHAHYPGTESLYPLILLLGAYVLQQLRRRDELFLWMVYAFSSFQIYFSSFESLAGLGVCLFQALSFTFFFAMILLGLFRKLRYSNLPSSAKGLPAYFLCSAVLSLFLWVFQGTLF